MPKDLTYMVEIRESSETDWVVSWPPHVPDQVKARLGLPLSMAKAYAAELSAPVTGYHLIGTLPHPDLCRQIRGYGMSPENVRITHFRKWQWKKYSE